MEDLIMAEENARNIQIEDKIFGINKKAQEMAIASGKEKVVNATIGSLLDDQGNLIILSSVIDVLKGLSPLDYAEYAPIAGIPSFLEATKKAVFMDYVPLGYVEAVSTPGGTGAVRNAIQNYTKRGDQVLTSDWYWSPYMTIAQELERSIKTFDLFDDDFHFNISSFEQALNRLLMKQKRVLIIINTPSHNPTGYTLTLKDWDSILSAVKTAAADDKKIILLVDAAYLDFAGDSAEARAFLPKLDALQDNILVLIAFSMSKSFTLYGMRGGALICLTQNKGIADEFKLVNSFSNRGTWSNSTRAAMVALSRIFGDGTLLRKVRKEREAAMAMLLKRGRTFTEAAKEFRLSICPYSTGFFAVALCNNPEEAGEILQREGIFTVPFSGRGLRISIASVSQAGCAAIPEKMALAIKNTDDRERSRL